MTDCANYRGLALIITGPRSMPLSKKDVTYVSVVEDRGMTSLGVIKGTYMLNLNINVLSPGALWAVLDYFLSELFLFAMCER